VHSEGFQLAESIVPGWILQLARVYWRQNGTPIMSLR